MVILLTQLKLHIFFSFQKLFSNCHVTKLCLQLNTAFQEFSNTFKTVILLLYRGTSHLNNYVFNHIYDMISEAGISFHHIF